MKAIIKRPTYVLLPGRVHLKYRDIAHHPGGIIWFEWKGRIRSVVSDGGMYHHNLDGRVRMDLRWRGRVDSDQKIGTMMPPLKLYTEIPEKIPVPGWIVARLKIMGAKFVYVDTAVGMRKVVKVTGKDKVKK
jgi:hypothetical protein